MTATSLNEQPVYLKSGDDDLFGILTTPTAEPNGIAVLLLGGGAWMPATHRNRMHVRLARRLAGLGYHSLRLDYHGVGESTGHIDYFDLSRPFVADAIDAADWLRARGHERIVLTGTCFGGRTSLAAANRVEGIAGVGLIASPVENHRGESKTIGWHLRKGLSLDTLAKLRDRGKRRRYARIGRSVISNAFRRRKGDDGDGQGASRQYLAGMSRLVDNGVPMLIMFGRESSHYESYEKAKSGRLGELIEAAGDAATEVVVDGVVHGLLTQQIQDITIDTIEAWLSTLNDQPAEQHGLFLD